MILHIKKDLFLKQLKKVSGMTEENIVDRVVGCLWGAEAVPDDPSVFGLNVEQLLEKSGFNEDEFVQSVMEDPAAKKLILGLTIVWSTNEDNCPDCGCELDRNTDGAFGIVWEEEYCKNECCEYFATTEPDWELL